MNLAKEYYQRNDIKVPLVDFSKYGFLILKAKSRSRTPDSVLWDFFRVEKATRSLMPPCYIFERYSLKSHNRPKKNLSPSLSFHGCEKYNYNFGCQKYNSHFVSLYFNVEKTRYVELEEYEQYMFDLSINIDTDVVISDPSLLKISALQIFIIENQKEFCKIGQNKVKCMSIVFDEKVPQASKLLLYSMCSNGNALDETMKKKWIEFKRVIVEGYNYPFAEFLKSF